MRGLTVLLVACSIGCSDVKQDVEPTPGDPTETETETSPCADADSDGVCDELDPCPDDTLDDSDGDGSCDSDDICPGSDDTLDSDGDATPDGCDDCPVDATGDSDGDGSCDSDDLCPGFDDSADADSDGVADGCDDCPDDADDDSDGDGLCDSDDACPGFDDADDTDADGVADGCDACPDDPLDDSDGDGTCDSDDLCAGYDDAVDTDADGIPDGCDLCPDDAGDDTDGDGVCDAGDQCPGFDDSLDADLDGAPDACDGCPLDAADDSDGDGSCDSDDVCPGFDDTLDTDSDGVPNGCDACPGDPLDDSDGDGTCDSDDLCPGGDDTEDADTDGVPNDCDACPDDPLDDSDGDGICDSDDTCPGGDDTLDADSDGTPDDCDACPDDALDDSDGDGTCDSDDLCPGGDDTQDADTDGVPDDCDACPADPLDDSDGDGVCDSDDVCLGGDDGLDADSDGTPDDCDACPLDATDDSDGDGVCDSDDLCPGADDTLDADSDGVPDDCDACPADLLDDSDGDGVCDSDDVCPADPNDDSDGDGVCDSDDICAGGDDGVDADGDGVPDACAAVGAFGGAGNWPVPHDTYEGDSSGFYHLSEAGAYSQYSVFDINGDDLPDIVQTADINGYYDVWGYGTPNQYWQVFFNTGSGYDLTPTAWPVPHDSYEGDSSGFYHLSEAGAYSQYSVFDINGDNLPDIVQTADINGYYDVWGYGTPNQYWNVFFNNGAGFDAAPTAWPVPHDSYEGDSSGFYHLSEAGAYSQYSVFDIDGDGLPDIVQTADINGYYDVWGYGTPNQYWNVFFNNGAGFDPTPTAWPVPHDSYEGDVSGFYHLSEAGAYSQYSVFDIDGDGLPDIVQTADINGYYDVWGYGTPDQYWSVFYNTGAGFDPTPTVWTVPHDTYEGDSSGFYHLSEAGAYSQYSVFDIDGDRLPDIVQTADINGYYDVWGYGTPDQYWNVFLNNGTGFETEPLRYSVPHDTYEGDSSGFYHLSEAGAYSQYSVFDINGDQVPDIVQTADINGYYDVWGYGTPNQYWQVYLGGSLP